MPWRRGAVELGPQIGQGASQVSRSITGWRARVALQEPGQEAWHQPLTTYYSLASVVLGGS